MHARIPTASTTIIFRVAAVAVLMLMLSLFFALTGTLRSAVDAGAQADVALASNSTVQSVPALAVHDQHILTDRREGDAGNFGGSATATTASGALSNCCDPHGGLGCDALVCQQAVCMVQPWCCQNGWDAFCAELALTICHACRVDVVAECFSDANIEPERCGDDVNGGCNMPSPSFTSIECGDSFCGTVWALDESRDTDWYEITITEPIEMTLAGEAEFPVAMGFVDSLGDGNCQNVGGFAAVATGAAGEEISVTHMLEPGTWWIFVSTNGLFDGIPCSSDNNNYVFTLFCESIYLNVPQDYPTIQSAIDAAENGDTINIAPGTYNENIVIDGMAVRLLGSAGPDQTILDAGGTGGSVVSLIDAPDALVIEGLTLTGGVGTTDRDGFGRGGAMSIVQGNPTIVNCILENNSADYGGAVDMQFSSAQFINTTFRNNSAMGGGAVSLGSSQPTFETCEFIENTADQGGAVRSWGSSPLFTNCVFMANDAAVGGGALYGTDRSTTMIVESILRDNSSQNGGAVFGESDSPVQIIDTLLCDNTPNQIVGPWTSVGSVLLESCADSCEGHCGGNAPGGCSCHSSCHEIGNCCPAICLQCGECDIVRVPQEFPTIQEAIDFAPSNGVVLVGPGTYYEAINLAGKVLHVRSVDGPLETVIDATGVGTAVITANSGEGIDTIIEGFTITGGSSSAGGGMHNNGTSPKIVNCHFVGNNSTGNGGGMYNLSSHPTVINSMFADNSASGLGGGMFNAGGSSPTLTGTQFINNVGTGNGGGMFTTGGDLIVTDCIFDGNTTNGSGGGMFNFSNSSATIVDTVFTGNIAGGNGGGLMNQSDSVATIANCRFESNEVGSLGGGLLNLSGSHAVISESVFSTNVAGIGGGIANAAEGVLELVDCSFEANHAGVGGGLYGETNTSTSLAMSTFCQNEPDSIDGPWEDLGGNWFRDVCDTCPEDIDGSGVVDVSDMLLLLGSWGKCNVPEDCPSDLNGDGQVGVPDLLMLLAAWGACP